MWRQVYFSIITVCLLDVGCAVTEFIGYEGKNISFQLTYPAIYEKHDKYIGRSDGFFSKKLVQTSQAKRWFRNGRVAVFDNTSALRFIVFISASVTEDSGLYFCGVDVTLQVDPVSKIQITVRKGEGQRPTTPQKVVISSLQSPANITVQNQANNKNQESHLRFVAVLCLVCVCALLCVCPFLLSKVLKRAGKLSVSVSYHTRKISGQVVDEYVTMSPVVLSNCVQTSHSDERSAVNDVNRSTQNTAVADVDLHHTDAVPALTQGLDLDQIYTKTDVDPFQESIYQVVDQMSDGLQDLH